LHKTKYLIMALGRSARYYRSNPEARAKKQAYDTEYHATPERKKYRAGLNRARRKRGLRGDSRDLSHTKSNKLVLESRRRNRARNGSGNRPTKK
jgi:hypothetical protein